MIISILSGGDCGASGGGGVAGLVVGYWWWCWLCGLQLYLVVGVIY